MSQTGTTSLATDQAYYNNRIEITHMAFLYVSAWSCLIRTDYNFVLMFFLYFVWANRPDKLTVQLLLYANIGLLVFDFIFFLSTFGAWTSTDPTNTLWNSLQGLHGFAIFTSVTEEVVRLIALYYLYRRSKTEPN